MGRQRIGDIEKWLLLMVQSVVNVLDILFDIIAVVPIVGMVGTILSTMITLIWSPILMIILILLVGKTSGRMWKRFLALGLVAVIRLAVPALVPMIGGVIEILLMVLDTTLLYLFIRHVQKEDEEYNRGSVPT